MSEAYQIQCIRTVIHNLLAEEEVLREIDGGRFGPDFIKALDGLYAARRFLELALEQAMGEVAS